MMNQLLEIIKDRDTTIEELREENLVLNEQLSAAIDSLNEAFREIDRHNAAKEEMEMVNALLQDTTPGAIKVDFDTTLESVIAGTLVKYDARPGTLTPQDLLALAELKMRFKPSSK